MQYAIQLNKISKRFNQGYVLNEINFGVKTGEIFGFLGPSGSGKTTTLKIITNQLIPTSGEVLLWNKNHKEISLEQIGILSDNSSVYERLTIKENLMLFARIHDVSIEEVDRLLKRIRLYEDKNKPVKTLSKGMKQRLLLACSVIHKPKLLFLDEPTSSLDPTSMIEIQNLIKEINEQGTTIFLTTHNMYEADKLCHRIAFLNGGEIIEVGSPAELKQKYRKNTLVVTLLDNSVHLIDLDTSEKYELLKWIEESKILTIKSDEPTIEDIFIALTGRELV